MQIIKIKQIEVKGESMTTYDEMNSVLNKQKEFLKWINF